MFLKFSLPRLLKWVALVCAVVLALRGQGAHGVVLLCATFIPLGALAVSSSYRREFLHRRRAEFGHLKSGRWDFPSFRSAFHLIFIPALVLYLINGRGILLSSYDNYGVNLTAISLLERQSSNVAPYLEQSREPLPYSFRTTSQGVYSNYPAGMLPFALGVFALSKVAGGDVGKNQWRLAKLSASLMAALALTLLFFVLSVLAGALPALWVTGFLGLSSALFTVVSQGLWSNGGVLFWEVVFLFLGCSPIFQSSSLVPVLQGMALANMLSCRLTAVLFMIPLLAFSVWVSLRKTLLVLISMGLFFVPWAWYYHSIYGSIFGPQQAQSNGFVFSLVHFGQGALGLLFSPARGFFVYQPWALLVFALVFLRPSSQFLPQTISWLGLTKARSPQWFTVALSVSILVHFCVTALWSDWAGGWCWGPRLLTEITPAVSVLCAWSIKPLSEKNAAGFRRLAICLGAFGFLIHAVGAFGPGIRWFDSHYSSDMGVWLQNQWNVLDSPLFFRRE